MSLAVGNAGRWDVILCRVWLHRGRLLEEVLCMRLQSVSLSIQRRQDLPSSEEPCATKPKPWCQSQAAISQRKEAAPLAQEEDATREGTGPLTHLTPPSLFPGLDHFESHHRLLWVGSAERPQRPETTQPPPADLWIL